MNLKMQRDRQSASKSKRQINKSLNATQSKSTSKIKNKSLVKQLSKSKRKNIFSNQQQQKVIKQLKKKSQKSNLVKKKIDDLKTPDLIIKVSYKSKRISIPINNVDQKCLKQTVTPHIIRFQKQILKNAKFDQNSIVNWKTIGQGDVLKDFYFQTNKPINVFKGQVLQIQPIWIQNRPDHVSLENFQIIKCIGTGGFSRVFLARFKSTGKFYALKLMQKQGLLQSGKECVVTNQRDIMVDLDSPYVLNLDYAFQTKHFVALALDYCPGGQLFYYLRKVKRMSEDQARYCFIQILLGIQYLHSKNIIYRDIKPENIMIDQDGNLKIADFGLSKMGIRPHEFAYTYCGSPQYMAPEMLTKSGHNFSVDYYCLGALLYELVTGNPPFYSKDVQKIYYAIQNQEIDFPYHVSLSPEIKMLLEGLLIKQPKRRLGSLGGIRQILGHPWVRKLKPADVINKIAKTPIQIDLLTFNINQEDIQQGDDTFNLKLSDQCGGFQQIFEGFYFNRFEDMKVLEEIFPSVKSDSTKENKSSITKIPQPNTISQNCTNSSHGLSTVIHSSNKKTLDIKSSLSRQKFQKFSIQLTKNQPNSDINRQEILKPKGNALKLKKQKSKKQLNLIERAKPRPQEEKSMVRISKSKEGKHNKIQRAKSPVNKNQVPSHLKKSGQNHTLKRIKSSTALLHPLSSDIKFY